MISKPSRRAVAVGAAWTVPVMVGAQSVPAFAASEPGGDIPVPPDDGDSKVGLQGLLNIAKGCGGYQRGPYSMVVNTTDISDTKPVYDDKGELVRYGFYVENGKPTVEPRNAKLTIYVPSRLGSIRWTNRATSSGWSNLTVDRTVPQHRGMTAYSAVFRGQWVYHNDSKQWIASGPAPQWGANPPNLSLQGSACGYCNNGTMPAAARREVTVGDKVLTFTRGVRNLL